MIAEADLDGDGMINFHVGEHAKGVGEGAHLDWDGMINVRVGEHVKGEGGGVGRGRNDKMQVPIYILLFIYMEDLHLHFDVYQPQLGEIFISPFINVGGGGGFFFLHNNF